MRTTGYCSREQKAIVLENNRVLFSIVHFGHFLERDSKKKLRGTAQNFGFGGIPCPTPNGEHCHPVLISLTALNVIYIYMGGRSTLWVIHAKKIQLSMDGLVLKHQRNVSEIIRENQGI